LTAAWKAGEEIWAEVSLAPEQREEAGRYAIHPALLDSALHAMLLSAGEEPRLALPFAWSGVSVGIEGAGQLRVRLSTGEREVSLSLADSSGAPLGAVGSLALRAPDPALLQGAKQSQEDLLGIEWTEVPLDALDDEADVEVEQWRFEGDLDSGDPPAAAKEAVEKALAALKDHLTAETEDSRLALITEGAVATEEGESPDIAAASIWGLVRSAQAEHPGRFLLIDSDGSDASEEAMASAFTSEEPQLALREGRALAPRALPAADRGSLIPPPGPWRLDVAESGTLESLALVPDPRAAEPLGPGEVRIAMRAAGLNFRDVLVALGFDVPGRGRWAARAPGSWSRLAPT
jgi:hypothetical protein